MERNKGRKQFLNAWDRVVDREGLQAYDAQVKAEKDAIRQVINEAWQAKKWW